MDIVELIEIVKKTPSCIVHPPIGLPHIKQEHILPDDLRIFYTLSGGMTLFEKAPLGTEIVSPRECVLSNPVILRGIIPDDDLYSDMNHPSWSWYIIGKSLNAQYISIDFHPARLGLCYDSFWDVHPQDSEVIALSFTNLIINLLSDKGEGNYWKKLGFQPK